MRDPYLYDDVDVLINNAGIKDEDLLLQAEADITALSILAVYNKQYQEFNFQTLCDIHKDIFGYIYPWAGTPRTIQIYKDEVFLNGKSVNYSDPFYFDKEFEKIDEKIKQLRENKFALDEFIQKLAEVIADIWKVHPFREGNTRTSMVFCVLLVRSLGYIVDSEVFSKRASFVRHALVRYHDENAPRHYDFEYVLGKAIKLPDGKLDIMESISPERYTTVDKKYKTIDGVDVTKYKVTPHKYVDKNENQ